MGKYLQRRMSSNEFIVMDMTRLVVVLTSNSLEEISEDCNRIREKNPYTRYSIYRKENTRND